VLVVSVEFVVRVLKVAVVVVRVLITPFVAMIVLVVKVERVVRVLKNPLTAISVLVLIVELEMIELNVPRPPMIVLI
jgi:hypothetical protein